MKKSLVIMLIFMLLFSLVACTPQPNPDDDTPGGGETPQLQINDVLVFTNNTPGYILPRFVDGATPEELNFTYDENKLSIDLDTMTVTGYVAGKHRVKATSQSYTAQFAVYVRDGVEKFPYQDIPFFNASVQNHWLEYWKTMVDLYHSKGTNGKTTIFIGDSFFDEANFWTNFYEEYYPQKDALCMGIGSTTSASWEKFVAYYWQDIQPKNLVIHIGTNNVYDQNRDAVETIYDLQRMFLNMHEKMPNTNIYFYSITQRGYEMNAMGQFATVDQINATMKLWCETVDWLTFLDTCDQLPASSLKDKIHPILSEYRVFTDALEQSGCQIEDK